MNRVVAGASLVAAALLASPGARAQPSSSTPEEFLAAAKSTRAAQIEPGLPETPVDAWLASILGPAVPMSWSVSDCGEQTGVPETDSRRDIPVCGELTAALSPERTVYLSFLVGTASAGVAPMRASYGAAILTGEHRDYFRTLSALAAALREEKSE